MIRLLAVTALLATPAAAAAADDAALIPIVIENHVFSPDEIHVKANQAAVLAVENRDATAEEFDSSELKVEKIVAGHATATVRLRPLRPGRYRFAGEYHEGTAHGVVIAE